MSGIDQLPPNDFDAERGVLSCALQAPNDVMPEIAFKVTTDSFYDLRCRLTWGCLVAKHERNDLIDIVTVMSAMKAAGTFDQVGGLPWLKEVQDFAPSPAGVSGYVSALKEKEAVRRLIQGCQHVVSEAMAGTPFNEIRTRSSALFEVEGGDESEVLDGNQAANSMLVDLERRCDLQGELSGLDTGIWKLNSITNGLQFGEQTLVGARPSMGKTALGLNIFHHTSFVRRVPSLFISLEMSVPALMRRLLSAHTLISMSDIRCGSYTKEQFAKFASFRATAAAAPIHFVDGVSGMTIGEIAYRTKVMAKKHNIKLVVVDYLQRIQPGKRHEKRTYEVAEVSGRLKSLAVETGAAFLTLAQLNRESEKEEGRIPRLSDLADSGQIERDADTVALIHRDRSENTGAASLIIAKQRDGETGMVPLNFNGMYCRFETPPVQTEESPTNTQHNY